MRKSRLRSEPEFPYSQLLFTTYFSLRLGKTTYALFARADATARPPSEVPNAIAARSKDRAAMAAEGGQLRPLLLPYGLFAPSAPLTV